MANEAAVSPTVGVTLSPQKHQNSPNLEPSGPSAVPGQGSVSASQETLQSPALSCSATSSVENKAAESQHPLFLHPVAGAKNFRGGKKAQPN